MSVPVVHRQPVVPQDACGEGEHDEWLVEQVGDLELGTLGERMLAPEGDLARLGPERLQGEPFLPRDGEPQERYVARVVEQTGGRVRPRVELQLHAPLRMLVAEA